MRYSMAARWEKRIKLLWSLPFPNRALRFFPPEFIIRDPLLSLVHAYRRKGLHYAVIVIHMDDFQNILAKIPYSLAQKLLQQLKYEFIDVLKRSFNESLILGVKQFNPDDFTVILKVDKDWTYEDLHQKEVCFRKDVELNLNHFMEQQLYGRLKFQSGSMIVGQSTEHTEAALQAAYYYALCVATDRLPAHFAPYRLRLQEIIKDKAIYVLTQPIMCLDTGEIFGWEVLTRGPQHSPFHTPTELFEFAHQADLLQELEYLVLEKAFLEISSRSITEQVFINITPISLMQPTLLVHVLNCLQQYPKILATQIIFEITERHSIRDYEQMGTILRNYRSHGFRFAVDDAGAGYSSLQSISELIPDMIKIDKSVIQNIDQVAVKQSLLRALLFFAADIKCQVIAEGIEREEEANILFDHQVKMGQGYYFAKPERMQFDYARTHVPHLKEKIMQMRAAYNI
ncbi:EAL domain-containing protein [Paenibacillus psychroresistens]|uniref:EAL domain-containing protein n=1 Tax=Paenibacillus psychroresistens TaxID=1778678 RepID=A0A6B8RGC9_9BACL|nr:EAL domain-containing protein [Paenibacillus psychroresistens]QGQ95240.1 EAL domain-containing protein [Paenibacillus psychroresistens]